MLRTHIHVLLCNLLCGTLCPYIHTQDVYTATSTQSFVADFTKNTGIYVITGLSCKALSYGLTYATSQHNITSDIPSILGGGVHSYINTRYNTPFTNSMILNNICDLIYKKVLIDPIFNLINTCAKRTTRDLEKQANLDDAYNTVQRIYEPAFALSATVHNIYENPTSSTPIISGIYNGSAFYETVRPPHIFSPLPHEAQRVDSRNNENCIICYDQLPHTSVHLTCCNNSEVKYHETCIKNYFAERSTQCPYCRTYLTPFSLEDVKKNCVRSLTRFKTQLKGAFYPGHGIF